MKLDNNKVVSLVKDIETNETLKQQFNADPVGTLQTHASSRVLETDKWIYRVVVFALSTCLLTIIIGIFANLKEIETKSNVITIVTALGSAAIGAMAGLLAPSPVQSNND